MGSTGGSSIGGFLMELRWWCEADRAFLRELAWLICFIVSSRFFMFYCRIGFFCY
jgi:hypothetical protein